MLITVYLSLMPNLLNEIYFVFKFIFSRAFPAFLLVGVSFYFMGTKVIVELSFAPFCFALTFNVLCL